MKRALAPICVLLTLILTAFSFFPVPLFALPLNEGRTLDEGHDLGLFDWHNNVSYTTITHRDGVCPEGCSEQVTRIQDGSSVTGSFAAGNVNYFEAMVAFERRAGIATLQACSSIISWDLHASGVPGFVSMPLYVPAGCTQFSLSASGGFVDFRSMDVGYGSPVTPPATNTWTVGPPPTFTSTFTLTPSQTASFTPVNSDTPDFTPTEITGSITPETTDTPTVTDTPTIADTPTITDTPSNTVTPPGGNTLTVTSTPVHTLTSSTSPTITSSVLVPTRTPGSTTRPGTPTSRPPSGGGVSPVNSPVIPPVNRAPAYTPTVVIPVTGGVVKTQPAVSSKPVTLVSSSIITSTPVPFSNISLKTTPDCKIPSAPPVSTAGVGSFAGILAAAGLSIAAVLSLVQSFLQKPGSTVTSSSSGFTISVPRTVEKKVTLWEYVTRPIRVLVQIARTIWRTIVEAIPRFINVTRKIVENIWHSEWVTTYIRVAKTVYQWVLDRVPLLGFLGRIISWFWKYVLKPIIQWVTQAIRTLRTWVEAIVRWVVQKIQDGWNYITRKIQETIHEWVEQTQWVKELASRQVTVKEVVWETQFVPYSSLVNSAGIKRLIQVGVTAGIISLAASQCNPIISKPTPTPNYQQTQVACVVGTMQAENTKQAEKTVGAEKTAQAEILRKTVDAKNTAVSFDATQKAEKSKIQVDLSNYNPKKQYDPDVVNGNNYGYMACGLIAGANAGVSYDEIGKIAKSPDAVGKNNIYTNDGGIQPSPLFNAYSQAYDGKVSGGGNQTIDEMYQQLKKDKIIVVDILVNQSSAVPSTKEKTIAHFARVLGMDLNKKLIYIENTLPGPSYWEIPIDDFLQVWNYPETSASIKPSGAEHVTNWAAYIERK